MATQRCQDTTCRDQVEVYVEQVDQCYCASCAGLLHSSKTHVHIPNPKASYSCIEQGYHIVKKVNEMTKAKKLNKVWAKFLPELTEFEAELKELRERYYEITENRTLIELPSLQKNCFDFITKLYESEALQSYLREHMVLSMKLDKDQIECSSNRKSEDQRKTEMLSLVDKASQLNQETNLQNQEPIQQISEAHPPPLAEQQNSSEMKDKLDAIAISLEEIKNKDNQVIIQEERKHMDDDSSGELEEMKYEIESLSQKLQTQNQIPTHESFNELYQKITGTTGTTFNSGSNLKLDLSNTTSQTLIRCLQFYKLPELHNVEILNIHQFNQPEVISNFMKNAIHPKIKNFHLYFTTTTEKSFSKNFSPNYYEALKQVASVIPQFIYINNFTLSQTEYQDLLVAAKKCKRFYTNYCYVEFKEECKFGNRLDDAEFVDLSLYETGGDKYGKWKQEGFGQFKNFITGLAKVQYVKDTQINIYLDNCGMTKAEARQMLDSVGLKNMIPQGVS
ncbi:unnamed protein product [Moneuplotes crassus]|uniref:Uncharacterized protein n=1 Tax=Euplotes crassus TaxID=5936 RepID=A0AAD1X6C8_EUPCR|nr:unnamed protein product [Moneuplotes crassus]